MRNLLLSLLLFFGTARANAECPIFITIITPDDTVIRSVGFFGQTVYARWNACPNGAPLTCDNAHLVEVFPLYPAGEPGSGGALVDIRIRPWGHDTESFRRIISRTPTEFMIGEKKTPDAQTFDRIPAIPTPNDLLKMPAEQEYSGEGILRIESMHACF